MGRNTVWSPLKDARVHMVIVSTTTTRNSMIPVVELASVIPLL